jgi:hypothetical protein
LKEYQEAYPEFEQTSLKELGSRQVKKNNIVINGCISYDY